MKIQTISLFFFASIFSSPFFAQALENHLWQERVILLFTSDFENKTLQKQLDIIEKDQNGLRDRKLITYQITPEQIKKNGAVFFEKKLISNVLKKYKPKKEEFTFILIGLDSGEKMRSTKVVSLEKLFGKIDQMPMRKFQLEQKKNN